MLLSLLSALAHSQVDTTYIGSFPQDFSIQASVYQKFTALTYEVDKEEIDYRPNSPVGIGVSVNYKNFSLSAGKTFSFMRDKKKGKTELLDFQYHYYGKKFIADVFFQNYTGFYVDKEDEKGERLIELHPDIKLAQYGVSGQYVFNNKKFSYRAAFHQREKQLKSTGSFHVGGGVYYNYLSGDDSFVVNQQNQFSNYQINISGGYAHTFVIKKNFFISLDVSAGFNLGAEKFGDLIKSVDVTPAVFPRVAMGYNARSWSVGVSGIVNQISVSQTKNTDIIFNTGRVNASFTKRFDSSPKILRKIKFLNK